MRRLPWLSSRNQLLVDLENQAVKKVYIDSS